MSSNLDSKSPAEANVHLHNVSSLPSNAHLYKRGEVIEELSATDAVGYDHELMKARGLLSYEEEKKLLRRVDWRLVPWVSLIFLVKSIDVNNAANVRIMNQGTPQNILTQLHMSADAYNLVNTVFFIPFIVFEIPSNLVMKYFLPSRWQARIMVSWGIVLAASAGVTSQSGLYAARFFLGVAEAGMFPGVILHLTYWYRPDEMTLRLLVFYAFENFSNVIGAVLAFAFDGVSGRYGISGWQWLFIVEGSITIAFGIAIWFILPDFPEQAKWLSEKEKAFLQARLPANAPRASDANFNPREILETLKDIRLWMFTFIWTTLTFGTSGLSFYLPTVVASLGLTSIAKSQLLTIPSSVLPIFIIAFSSWLSDRAHVPRPLIALVYLVGMLGCYGALYAYPSVGGVYAATIIAVAMSHAWYPVMWPWRLQTTSKTTGSAFAIAFSNSLGQIGFIVGPLIFQSKFAPKYTTSFTIAMVFLGLCILLTAGTWYLTRTTERQTRNMKTIRLVAARNGNSVLDDVDITADFEKKDALLEAKV